MSDHSKNRDDESHDEIIAGEYVLGVLSLEQRQRVERRLATEPSFASRVQRWQENLESLDEPYGPSGRVDFPMLDAKLFGAVSAQPVTLRSAMWDSVTFWRGLSLASITMAAGFAFVSIIINQPLASLKKPVLAKPIPIELNSPSETVKLVATYDAGSGRLTITPMDASTQPPKALEIFMVGSDGFNVLGELSPLSGGEILVPLDLRHYFTNGNVQLYTDRGCNGVGGPCRQKVE